MGAISSLSDAGGMLWLLDMNRPQSLWMLKGLG